MLCFVAIKTLSLSQSVGFYAVCRICCMISICFLFFFVVSLVSFCRQVMLFIMSFVLPYGNFFKDLTIQKIMLHNVFNSRNVELLLLFTFYTQILRLSITFGNQILLLYSVRGWLISPQGLSPSTCPYFFYRYTRS